MLCDAEILDACNDGYIHIDPFNDEQLNTNSYDVRLGNWFYLVKWQIDGPVFIGPSYVPDGSRVNIPIGGTLLGMTKEVIGATGCVVAELRSKSSTRRCGVTICDDAGFGDVGYINKWTVELTAHVGMYTHGVKPYEPYLIVGERFAQAVFFKTGKPIREYQGQYIENEWPINMIPKKYRDRIVEAKV
jgi:dCTP deaminase